MNLNDNWLLADARDLRRFAVELERSGAPSAGSRQGLDPHDLPHGDRHRRIRARRVVRCRDGARLLRGLGNGAVDAGLNHFVASNLSSRHMNWLHAFWGVGISLGTLIVSGVLALEGTWRSAYAVVGAIQLSLAVAFSFGLRSVATLRAPEASPGDRRDAPALLATLALPASWASMASFFVYCGIECGTGLWIASVLHDGRGWSMQAAGLMVTLFWGSLTFGRFMMGVVSQRTTPVRIVRVATVGVIFGTGLIAASSAIGGRTTAAGFLTAPRSAAHRAQPLTDLPHADARHAATRGEEGTP